MSDLHPRQGDPRRRGAANRPAGSVSRATSTKALPSLERSAAGRVDGRASRFGRQAIRSPADPSLHPTCLPRRPCRPRIQGVELASTQERRSPLPVVASAMTNGGFESGTTLFTLSTTTSGVRSDNGGGEIACAGPHFSGWTGTASCTSAMPPSRAQSLRLARRRSALWLHIGVAESRSTAFDTMATKAVDRTTTAKTYNGSPL